MNQFGGLKLKNADKYGFKALFDMLNSNSASIEVLSYSSLKGFIFKLSVDENDSEYYGLNQKTNTLDNPVTNFIIKFAVILPIIYRLPAYIDIKNNRILKLSESRESFFNEAKLQQKIWIKSIIGGREEICPPIANFLIFPEDSTRMLLKFMLDKINNAIQLNITNKQNNDKNMKTKHLLIYLIKLFYSKPPNGYSAELGCILMPTIKSSITFSQFFKIPNNSILNGLLVSDNARHSAFAIIVANVARLFLDIGVIHFDLHGGNILICILPNSKIKIYIIDFGIASDLYNPVVDPFFTVDEKRKEIKYKDEHLEQLLSYRTFKNKNKTETDIIKKEYIKEVLDHISYLDRCKNSRNLNKPAYQMRWYELYKKDYLNINSNPNVSTFTYDILKIYISTIGVSINPNTISQYQSKGLIINLDSADKFVIPMQIVHDTIMSTIHPPNTSNQNANAYNTPNKLIPVIPATGSTIKNSTPDTDSAKLNASNNVNPTPTGIRLFTPSPPSKQLSPRSIENNIVDNTSRKRKKTESKSMFISESKSLSNPESITPGKKQKTRKRSISSMSTPKSITPGKNQKTIRSPHSISKPRLKSPPPPSSLSLSSSLSSPMDIESSSSV